MPVAIRADRTIPDEQIIDTEAITGVYFVHALLDLLIDPFLEALLVERVLAGSACGLF